MADRIVAVGLTANTAAYVAGMNKASQAAAKTEQATQRIGSSVDKTSAKMNVFRNIALYAFGYGAAVGIAQVAKKAIATVMDFEVAMSELGAASQASADDMDAMSKAALDAGKNTVFTATEAAGAMTELAKAGVSTSDILGGALAGALDLAAAGGVDVGFAAETAATAMVQFNLSGSQMGHVADLLAAGAGKAQGGVEDLALALRQGGQVASMVGWSFEDTTTALTAFAAAGLLGSDAGTSLKTMLLRLARPSNQAAEVMERYGLSVYDASGSMVGAAELAGRLTSAFANLDPQARNAAMGIIFGTDAVRAANVLFENGQVGISEWANKVNDSGYAAEVAAQKTDNLAGDLNRLKGTIEAMTIDSSGGLLGALRDIVQGVNNTLNALDKFNSIFPTLEAPTGDQFKFDLFKGVAFQIGDLLYYLNGLSNSARKSGDEMSAAALKALEYGEGVRFANRAAIDSKAASDTAADGLDAIAQSAADAEEEIDALKEAILGLGQNAIDTSRAHDQLTEAIKDAKQPFVDLRDAKKELAAASTEEERAAARAKVAAAEAAISLKGNSEAAIANRESLRRLAEQGKETAAAFIDGTARGADKARAETLRARDAFIATAIQMGYTKTEARRLADQYGLIPGNVDTDVALNGAAAAEAAAVRVRNAVLSIPAYRQVEIVTKATRIMQNSEVGGGYRGGWASDIAGYAGGGFVAGPGSSTSDSVLARLSRGEFVVNARAASDYGPLLEAINKGMSIAPAGGDTFVINATTESIAREVQAQQRAASLRRRVA